MTVRDGVLDVSGDRRVSGPLTWSGGTMQGPGQTIAQGGLTISDPASKQLTDRTLRNAGMGAINTCTIGGTGTLTKAAGNTLTMTASTINAGVVNGALLVATHRAHNETSTNHINGSFANLPGGTVRVLPINDGTVGDGEPTRPSRWRMT